MPGLLHPPTVAVQAAYEGASLGLAVAATVRALTGRGLLLVRSRLRRDTGLRTLAALAFTAATISPDPAEPPTGPATVCTLDSTSAGG